MSTSLLPRVQAPDISEHQLSGGDCVNQARTDAKILRETKMKKKRTAGTKIHNEGMLHQRNLDFWLPSSISEICMCMCEAGETVGYLTVQGGLSRKHSASDLASTITDLIPPDMVWDESERKVNLKLPIRAVYVIYACGHLSNLAERTKSKAVIKTE